MVRRRLRREPVAYILGRRGFRRLELAVDRRVLIPRPETELLVEVALELRAGAGARRRHRLGRDRPGGRRRAARVPRSTATDTSPAALEVARANAERLGLAERVALRSRGRCPARASRSTWSLANLPYVSEAEWPALQPEMTEWEPREALLAGPDGLDAIRALLAEVAAPRIEPPRGASALEVGDGQAAAVAELLREAGFGRIETRPDLAGIERVVVGGRP